MKILITGGNGFIGNSLLNRFKEEGHETISFDIQNGGRNILDVNQIRKDSKGCDAVFHLAAVADLNYAREQPAETMDINVQGTANVAAVCNELDIPLYYGSTCCVYGNQECHPTDESSLPKPTEFYACTKLAGEYVIEAYRKMYGLNAVYMRFATTYGPNMREALGVHIFLDQALNGKDITVHGDGRQTRTLTYIDDLIDGIMALFNSDINDGVYNLTTEEEVSAIDMAKEIKKLCKSDSRIVFIPQRPGQIFRELISAQKAKRDFGWGAKTEFRDGLRNTYDWIREILGD